MNSQLTVTREFHVTRRHFGQKRFLIDHFSVRQGQPLQRIAAQGGDENAVLPFREQIALVEGDLRDAHGRRPVVDRLFDAGLYDPKTKTSDVQAWLKAESYDQHGAHAPHHAAEHHGHGHDHDHAHNHGAHDHGAHDHGAHDHHGHAHDAPDVNRHDDRIRAFCFNHDQPIVWEALATWVDTLLMRHGVDVLRLKGIVNVAGEDKPVVIHGVQHVFHPPVMLEAWPSDDRRTRLVVIARDLEPAVVEKLFHAVTGAVEALAPGAEAGAERL